jgi:hypothetical protein
MHANRAAEEEGLVSGGGVALLNATLGWELRVLDA